MTMQSTTLRPGFLVSLRTSVRGGVQYARQAIETATEDTGAQTSRWETQKTVVDPKENEAARKVRSAAAGLVRGVCAQSAFGLLCPENSVEKLEAAISEARRLAADFNAVSLLTRIDVHVITGRIAPNDTEAVRAINGEVAELMATMQKGIEALDVKSIRDAASRLREVGTMLAPNMEGTVKIAIEVARKTATQIAKVGDGVAQEVDRSAIKKLAESRTAFLDLDDGEAAPATKPKAQQRALELG